MTAGAEAVATFGERVGAVAHKPVSRRRFGDEWELRVRPTLELVSRGFSVDMHVLRLGGTAVRFTDTSLRIVRVDFTKGVLILRIRQVMAEVRQALAEADAVLAEAEQILRRIEQDPLRSAFARRAFRGIGRVATEASADVIASATGAPTDTEVVIRALEQPETLATLATADPLLPARLRGLRERERLLSVEGGLWDTEQVATHLHLTRQGVNRRRRTGALLGIDVGRRGYRYPAWQFARTGTLPGLEPMLSALRHHDVWMQLSFVLTPNTRLKGSPPLAALRAGRRGDVEAAARAFGEHGAA